MSSAFNMDLSHLDILLTVKGTYSTDHYPIFGDRTVLVECTYMYTSFCNYINTFVLLKRQTIKLSQSIPIVVDHSFKRKNIDFVLKMSAVLWNCK